MLKIALDFSVVHGVSGFLIDEIVFEKIVVG